MRRDKIKVILISTDAHTLGIQTVGKIISDNLRSEPIMFYLPANVSKYPQDIEHKILSYITSNLSDATLILIGFSVKELNKERSLQLATKIRKLDDNNSILLVAGGTYATACAEQLLPYFDYVVVGNGEGILKIINYLTNSKSDNLERIIHKSTNRLFPPLFSDNTYVLDDFGCIQKQRLRTLSHSQYSHRDCIELVLSTGCTGSCSYCEVATLRRLFPSYTVHSMPPQKLVNLIRYEIKKNSKIKYVYLFDEDFLAKPKRLIEEFCDLYKTISLPFFIFATPWSINKSSDKLEMLSKVGLDTINMGIQTGSEKVAREIFNRRESYQQIFKAVEILTNMYNTQRISSPPMFDFIILNPYENIKNIQKTFDLIRKLPVPFQAIMHSMSFFRGTPLYEKSLREGVIPPNYKFKYDLHDFVTRLRGNELEIDYRLEKNRKWLLWNILLYGMNGLHHYKNGERKLGSLTSFDIEQLLNAFKHGKFPTFRNLIDLAYNFPNPMSDVIYLWELPEKPEKDTMSSYVKSFGNVLIC